MSLMKVALPKTRASAAAGTGPEWPLGPGGGGSDRQQLDFELAVSLGREFAVAPLLREFDHPKLADQAGLDCRDRWLAAVQNRQLGCCAIERVIAENGGVAEHKLLGEWVYKHFEHIPAVGDSFEYNGLTLTVCEMKQNRIVKVCARIAPAEPEEEGGRRK